MAEDQFEATEQYMESSFKNMEHSFGYLSKIIKKLFGYIMIPLEYVGNILFPNGIDGDVGGRDSGDEFF
ncbi:MAG TPA: hypothetical protein VJ912_00605 [Candidatus Nanoarchaeia archaeon]|nr:hypothetical protein [Candidatus Nanoarchaeia archaeon]